VIEAHRALELIDRGLKLALHSERDAAFDDEEAAARYAADEQTSAAAANPSASSGVRWDGPPQRDPNAKPLPWTSFRPDVAPQRLA